MVAVTFGQYDFKTKQQDGYLCIFDEIRKKWVKLTPEEWVRQNIIRYLVADQQYPATLFAVEKELQLNGLRKRCDVVVYKNAEPWMIIECKEQEQVLNEAVLLQVLRYHMALPVQFLVITNGHATFAWQKENDRLKELIALPAFTGT